MMASRPSRVAANPHGDSKQRRDSRHTSHARRDRSGARHDCDRSACGPARPAPTRRSVALALRHRTGSRRPASHPVRYRPTARAETGSASAAIAHQAFRFGAQVVRVHPIDGEPWFAAADLARLCGEREAGAFIRKLPAEWRRKIPTGTTAGTQMMHAVNEAAMRQLFAERHEALRWLIATVRRHACPAAMGRCSTPPAASCAARPDTP